MPSSLKKLCSQSLTACKARVFRIYKQNGTALHALDRLIKWAKAERHAFMERLLGVAPTRSIQRVEQAKGLPQVDEIRQMLDNFDNEPDSDECDGDEDEAAGRPRCSFAPNRKENSKSLQTNGFVVADLVETNVFMHDSRVHDGAVALAESLEQLGSMNKNMWLKIFIRIERRT